MANLSLVVSDLQGTEGREGQGERLRANPAIPLQRWRIQQFYADIRDLYHEHGCKYLIDLGDTTDDRYALPVPTISAIMCGLEAIRPDPSLSIKLIGNHEQTMKSKELHPGLAYRSYHRVVEDKEVIIFNQTALIAMSWQNDPEQSIAWLNDVVAGLDGYRIVLLGHLEACGATINGRQLDGGVDLTGVVDLALLGHVHQPQEVRPNIHYVGSPFQQDYGELGQNKRVGLLDLDTLELKWLSLPSKYPRYLKLNFREFKAYRSLGEDRMTVTIRTQKEAAEFHGLSLSTLVDPDYQIASKSMILSAGGLPVLTVGDPLGALKTYTSRKPLGGCSEDQVLEVGRMITGL